MIRYNKAAHWPEIREMTYRGRHRHRYLRERGQNSNLDRRLGYVLVAIVKKRLNISASLYEILQILSLTMFERIPVNQLLNKIVTENS